MLRDIMAAIADSILVCEGAMGTMLTAHGCAARSSAEANLTHPEIVGHIHHRYQQAGARVFQTNTFAANPIMLARMGLLDRAADLWSAAVRICREAVGPAAFVCATGGPTGGLMAPLGDLSEDDVRAAVRSQFEVMLGPDIDMVLLEGFAALEEAQAAVAAVRELDPAIPLAVTMCFSTPTGRTSMGVDGATAVASLAPLNVQVLGGGCGMPAALELALREMAQVADRPLMAQPNAGLPQLCRGETLWAGTPTEAGELAARLITYGTRIVGGCCGSTPDHIVQVARAACAAV